MTNSVRAALAATASGAALLLHAGLASAQAGPPEYLAADEFGVNVITGGLNMTMPEVVIGQPGQSGLAFVRELRDSGMYFNFTGAITQSGSRYRVVIGGSSDVFTLAGSTFTSATGHGGSLVYNSGTGVYTYTAADGTVATFSNAYAGVYNNDLVGPQITSLRRPDGELLTYSYSGFEFQVCPEPWCHSEDGYRLDQVTTSLGWAIYLQYESDVTPERFDDIPAWFRIKGVTSNNLATSTAGLTRPSVSYSQAANFIDQDVTDQSGRTTRYIGIPNGFAIRAAGETSNAIAYTFTAPNRYQVQSVSAGGGTWSYAYATSGSTRTVTVTDPASNTTVYTSSLTTGRLTSVTDELNRTTSYQYDTLGRMTRVTRPEGDYTEYAYDARGNVTETTYTPKSDSDLDPIVVSSSYPATCTNPVICNLPVSTTDARGAVTDYTYDAAHGGVLTVTAPAPTSGAARPQTRFTYTNLSPGGGAGAVTRLTRISACATGASCLNTAQEVRTDFTYTPASPLSNLFVASVTQRSGNGALTATTTTTTNALGDVTAVDGPLSGTGDTTHYRYDTARQMVGAVGPDPDGAGPLLRRATRLTYSPAGLTTLAEQGTVTGLTDPNWAAFVTLQRQAAQYDALGRTTHVRAQAAGGANHALVQTRYDTLGRVECVATRMNPSTFASPPASACNLATTGTFGQDRITRYAYDAASQTTGVTSGYNSADPITQSFTWTDNGQVETARDGDGNLSTWVYDGFDRVHRLLFPTLNGSTSDADDYEQYGYDAAGNVTSHRTRGDQTFTTTYDALNRRTLLTTPTGMANVTYAWDNLNRLTSVSQPGHAVTYVWDALSRLTSQADPLGTFAFQYDAAGRRTRITWPDAFYAQYDWSLYDQLTAVRENGATSGAGVLANYAYDNLGRRSGVTRGNGVSTTYGYDAISRVTSIAHNLTGTAQDATFAMGYNPAGQITSRTISNDIYAYTPGNEDVDYAINGRNEITSADGTPFTYDANRNLIGDGVRSYAYDAANRMTMAGSAAMTYGPTGSLDEFGARRVGDVGGERMGVFTTSTGAVYRRFVPGAGMDEAAGYYHGAGTTTSSRRWPLTDHQGSVIAYADSTGAAAQINTYDEYGRPGAGNSQYLQYTGQLAISSTWGVQNYRNRFYNARIGRFMQIDPILYGDGLNLYGYVGNDPMNGVDPLGLCGFYGGGPYRDGSGQVRVPEQFGVACFPEPLLWPGMMGGGGGTGLDPGETGQAVVVAELIFPQSGNEESALDKAARCASAQLGLDDMAAAAAAVSGFNILETRGKFGGATPGTSIASHGASAAFGQARLPFRVPTIVGNPLTLSAGIRATSSVARVVGRGIPVVGWGLLAYDAARIAQCVMSDDR